MEVYNVINVSKLTTTAPLLVQPPAPPAVQPSARRPKQVPAQPPVQPPAQPRAQPAKRPTPPWLLPPKNKALATSGFTTRIFRDEEEPKVFELENNQQHTNAQVEEEARRQQTTSSVESIPTPKLDQPESGSRKSTPIVIDDDANEEEETGLASPTRNEAPGSTGNTPIVIDIDINDEAKSNSAQSTNCNASATQATTPSSSGSAKRKATNDANLAENTAKLDKRQKVTPPADEDYYNSHSFARKRGETEEKWHTRTANLFSMTVGPDTDPAILAAAGYNQEWVEKKREWLEIGKKKDQRIVRAEAEKRMEEERKALGYGARKRLYQSVEASTASTENKRAGRGSPPKKLPAAKSKRARTPPAEVPAAKTKNARAPLAAPQTSATTPLENSGRPPAKMPAAKSERAETSLAAAQTPSNTTTFTDIRVRTEVHQKEVHEVERALAKDMENEEDADVTRDCDDLRSLFGDEDEDEDNSGSPSMEDTESDDALVEELERALMEDAEYEFFYLERLVMENAKDDNEAVDDLERALREDAEYEEDNDSETAVMDDANEDGGAVNDLERALTEHAREEDESEVSEEE